MTRLKTLENAGMKNLFALAMTFLGVAVAGFGQATEEISIENKGRISAISTNGTVPLDVYYMVNHATNPPALGLYWMIKPGTGQVLITWSSNHVVDVGWTLCNFYPILTVLDLFHGLTNVANPYSEDEMRRQYGLIWAALQERGTCPNLTKLHPESKLPRFALADPPHTMGYRLRITTVQVAVSNVTVEVVAVNGLSETNNRAGKLVFDSTNLELVSASVTTNMSGGSAVGAGRFKAIQENR